MSLAESKGPEKWVRVGPKNDIGLQHQHQHQHSSLIFISHLQSSVYKQINKNIYIYIYLSIYVFLLLGGSPQKWVSSPQLNQQGVYIYLLCYVILHYIILYYIIE